MEMLKQEIERKQIELAKVSTTEEKIGCSRYIRQNVLKSFHNNQKINEQKQLDEFKKRKLDESLLPTANTAEQTVSKKAFISGSLRSHEIPQINITPAEVKQKLRKYGHPITLYGETDIARLDRLKLILHLDQSNEQDEYKIDALPNTFVAGQTGHHSTIKINSNDGTYDADGDKNSVKESVDRDDESNSSDDEEGRGADGKSGSTRRDLTRNALFPAYSKDPKLSKEKVIVKYFKSILKQWEWNLASRDEYTKSTAKGKMGTKTQKQCKDYIRPLFKQCKHKTLLLDIKNALFEMVKCCEEGDFLKANDHYLRCAIGNSAWPIGLTMVGIHERSGREKISSSKVAHIMNNELQRKYLSSVKRLMTYAQNLRPDVPPSKKLLV